MKMKFSYHLLALMAFFAVSGAVLHAELLWNPTTNVGAGLHVKNTMFADVALDHPNYNAIYYLKNTGVIQGDTSKDVTIPNYRPSDSVNRAEFLKIIYEGTGNANNNDYDSCFPDVKSGVWYTTYVCQAKEDGVVSGYPDGSFKPEQTINLAEALKILSELTGIEKPSLSDDLEWYEYYSIPAKQKNIMPVEDVGKLLTRAEIAEMIYRNSQLEMLNVPYYDQDFDDQLFDLVDIPLTGALGPGGLLGPGGPLGAGGAFTDDGPFVGDESGVSVLTEDFFSENYCYFSDVGDFSGETLSFLKDYGDADWDEYLSDDNLEDFGKMFCYPEVMHTDLLYFSEGLRSEYDVVCWQDNSLPELMSDDSQEILCYAAPPETSDSEFEESTLALYVGGFDEMAVNFDDSMVKVLEFNLGAYTDTDVDFYGIKVTNFGEGDGYGVRRFILKDDLGNVLYERPVYAFNWKDRSVELVFNQAAVISPGAFRWYSLYADFDWEDYNGELLFGFEDGSSILTLEDMPVHVGPDTDGPVISVMEPLDPPEEDWPACAFISPVDGWGYATEAEAEDPPASTTEETVIFVGGGPEALVLGPGAHVVKPITQQGSTCLSAAVYASIRWLEEKLELDNLIENGQAGYDRLKGLLHPVVPQFQQPGAYKQAELLKKFINENYPGCLVADFDSTWGTNPTCQSMKEYYDKGCDIPLQLDCNPIPPATSGVGHGVDVVDIQIDPNNPDQCTITFANSWKPKPGQYAGPETDGLGSGVYQQARYKNSDSSFVTEPGPLLANQNCYIFIADYICVDDIAMCPLVGVEYQ